MDSLIKDLYINLLIRDDHRYYIVDKKKHHVYIGHYVRTFPKDVSDRKLKNWYTALDMVVLKPVGR